MNEQKTGYARQAQTLQLSLTYLAIIMTMSISFSAVLYGVSARQLDRQLAQSAYIDENGEFGPTERVERYLQERVINGKQSLAVSMVVLNSIMLVFGGAISYLLARRALTPIEENIDAQQQFVNDAAHELRTPLTSLRLTNEVAARDSRMTLEGAKDVIASNLEEVIRLQNLSNLLLGLISVEQMEADRVTVAIDQLVQRAVDVVLPQAVDKSIVIDLRADADTLIRVNQELIIQAFVAVVDNAIKYSPPDSTIRIAMRQTKRHAYVSITDQGPGVKQKEYDQIFYRFYRSSEARTRSEQSGFGLGLSIARQIIEAHDGQITVKSQIDTGSEFSIKLPIRA